ncbi:MAG: glycosyltransferase [Desulfobacterota bacterium]|nr:glycosyltransferase [Thermodesulfobacteriota bacterium]
MRHHAPHAGYDRLADYIPSILQRPNTFYRLLQYIPERILARIRARAGSWYNSKALRQEMQAAFHMLCHTGSIYHFLYGEDGFHYAGYWNIRRTHRIIATYHMPPEKFSAITGNTEHIHTLDAVVVVAPNQEMMFKNLVSPERVHLIPHGIDTCFFTPGDAELARTRMCLFVGSHLRDFAMLRHVVKLLAQRDRTIRFVIVTNKSEIPQVADLPNTTVYTSISEDHLVYLYRTSSVLLLPMLDATANNTLLEALACGLPVVATETGGISMYGQRGGVVFVPPGDYGTMAQETLRIMDDHRYRNSLCRDARANAEGFGWDKIAQQMCRLYQSLYL